MQFNGSRKTLKKNRRNCPIPKIFAISIPVDEWNFCAKFRKNMSRGLEAITVFEGRTDRQTDRQTDTQTEVFFYVYRFCRKHVPNKY